MNATDAADALVALRSSLGSVENLQRAATRKPCLIVSIVSWYWHISWNYRYNAHSNLRFLNYICNKEMTELLDLPIFSEIPVTASFMPSRQDSQGQVKLYLSEEQDQPFWNQKNSLIWINRLKIVARKHQMYQLLCMLALKDVILMLKKPLQEIYRCLQY